MIHATLRSVKHVPGGGAGGGGQLVRMKIGYAFVEVALKFLLVERGRERRRTSNYNSFIISHSLV